MFTFFTHSPLLGSCETTPPSPTHNTPPPVKTTSPPPPSRSSTTHHFSKTAGGHAGRGVGGEQRRPQRERRLSYGKRRLRQIDRRIRFLTKRIDAAEVVDPEAPRAGRAATHVFFGATVRYACRRRTETDVRIVGVDEVDSGSPLHQLGVAAGARVDEVRPGRPRRPRAPAGRSKLEILDVRYERIITLGGRGAPATGHGRRSPPLPTFED